MATSTLVFDPYADLFIAQDDRPTTLRPVNLRTLSPFQRALMAIDGTVTRFIESYTMEPVEIDVLSQDARELDEDHDWLGLAAGEDVRAREVMLRGAYSNRLYAHAVSLLVLSRLPHGVLAALADSPTGLGGALAASGAETRREVLFYGRERIDPDVPHLARLGAECLSRTYRVIGEGQPFLLITERFPLELDPGPAHH